MFVKKIYRKPSFEGEISEEELFGNILPDKSTSANPTVMVSFNGDRVTVSSGKDLRNKEIFRKVPNCS